MQQQSLIKTKGIVKWFNDAKGYGFITSNDNDDIFCHYSQILGEGFKTLSEGQTVTFDLKTANSNLYGKGKDYLTATNIEKE